MVPGQDPHTTVHCVEEQLKQADEETNERKQAKDRKPSPRVGDHGYRPYVWWLILPVLKIGSMDAMNWALWSQQ